MKNLIIVAAVLFVLWYAMSRGLFAQLGSGLAPRQSGNFFNFETPWGNYAGGIQ